MDEQPQIATATLMNVNDRGKHLLEPNDEPNQRKKNKTTVEISTRMQFSSLTLKLQQLMMHLLNMVSSSYIIPNNENIFASLTDLTVGENLYFTGKNMQVFLDEIQLNPLIIFKEHAIAIATERNLFSLPLEVAALNQNLQLNAILLEETILTTHHATMPMENDIGPSSHQNLLLLPH